MNILVVDDETNMANSMGIGLESRGYRAFVANSGQQALDLLAHGDQKIDLVVTDYLMPLMDGFELIAALHDTFPTLPVMIMTGYAEKSLVIKALKIRCDGFIEKPFNLDQLVTEIERIRLYLLQNSTSDDLLQFLPRIAHQINNPLNIISGYAHLILLECDDGERVGGYADKILAAVELIGRSIKDIMNGGWAREDSFTPIDLNALLTECLAMFEGMFVLKGVKVKRDISVPGLRVMGDRSSLEHVFSNLILNAIDAMEDRADKSLSVSLKPSEDRSSIEGSIEDTGHGIPSELLEKIFEPYFTDKSKGNGLGLVITKRFLEKHGGKIQVESRVGSGSRFVFSLPAEQISRVSR